METSMSTTHATIKRIEWLRSRIKRSNHGADAKSSILQRLGDDGLLCIELESLIQQHWGKRNRVPAVRPILRQSIILLRLTTATISAGIDGYLEERMAYNLAAAERGMPLVEW
jgi:hypothetical protein